MTQILGDLLDTSAWYSHSGYNKSASALQKALTNSWGGAAFDYERKELHFVATGGHSDSWNNQSFKVAVPSGNCYVTDGAQTAWPPDQHVTGYAPTYNDLVTPTNGNGYMPDGTSPVTPYVDECIVYFDGKPASRHTYGGVVWLPTQQRVVMISGSCWNNGTGDKYCGWFDPVAGAWEQKGKTLLGYDGIGAAYDDVRDVVYWNRSGVGYVFKYDPATDTHTKIGTTTPDPLNLDTGPFVNMCCDGACDYLYATIRNGWKAAVPSLPATYNNALIRMSLAGTGLRVWEPVQITGDMSGVYGTSPGFEYDPERNAFVFWAKEYPNEVSILSLSSLSVARVPIAGASKPTDTNLLDTSSGTWGRFRRYAPNSYCLFVSALAPLFLITLK